jgi:hypothetical protein
MAKAYLEIGDVKRLERAAGSCKYCNNNALSEGRWSGAKTMVLKTLGEVKWCLNR